MSAVSHPQWKRQMKALHKEAAGCMEIVPVLFEDLPLLMAESRMGIWQSYLILKAIENATRNIETLPSHDPGRCGCCDKPLGDFVAFVVGLPYGKERPGYVLALAICGDHGPDREGIREAGIAGLRGIWPDARPIAIHQAAGRA